MSIILAGERDTNSWLLGVALGTPEIRRMFEDETGTEALPAKPDPRVKSRYYFQFFPWARRRYGMRDFS